LSEAKPSLVEPASGCDAYSQRPGSGPVHSKDPPAAAGVSRRRQVEARILRDLADRELPLIAQLELAERRLAERLLARIDDSREAAALARTLREVVGVTTDLARRLQGLLVAAAALQAQAAVVRAHDRRLAGDPGRPADES
jgi:hypothetical protein